MHAGCAAMRCHIWAKRRDASNCIKQELHQSNKMIMLEVSCRFDNSVRYSKKIR